MSNETPSNDDRAADKGAPESDLPEVRACEERKRDEEVRDISEHVRRVQLETEARILARWKKRGLFGLTTSTG